MKNSQRGYAGEVLFLLVGVGLFLLIYRSSGQEHAKEPAVQELKPYEGWGRHKIENPPPRFKVVRQYIFEDDLAYNSKRWVYLIIDMKTGQEMVGISGVGVSGPLSVPSGKTRKKVEENANAPQETP